MKNKDTLKEFKDMRAGKSIYSSLNFDRWGGVPLEFPMSEISTDRWDKKVVTDQFDDKSYVQLSDFTENETKLGRCVVVSQGPVRLNSKKDLSANDVFQHFERIKISVEQSGGHFLNEFDHQFEDGLFRDYSHLSKEGSELYTNFVTDFIKQKCKKI